MVGLISILVALLPPAHTLIYNDNAPLSFLNVSLTTIGDAYVPAALFVLGMQISSNPSANDNGAGDRGMKDIAIVAGVRMVIVPSIATLCLVSYGGWEDMELSTRLVLLLESCTPPAINLATMATLRGWKEGEVGRMLFWCYVGGGLTTACWVGGWRWKGVV